MSFPKKFYPKINNRILKHKDPTPNQKNEFQTKRLFKPTILNYIAISKLQL